MEDNTEQAIRVATTILLERIVSTNGIAIEDIASVVFTATADLDATYPARAARDLGWNSTPLLCTKEMNVRNSLPLCVRVLILWNTNTPIEQIKHVYMGAAASLRPDLAEKEEE